MRYKCGNCYNELKENANFCPKCGYSVVKHIGITLGVDSEGAYNELHMVYVSPEEIELANRIVKAIPGLTINRKNGEKTSIQYKDGDVCRIEYFNKKLFIHLCPSNEDRIKYKEHPFFANLENKNVAFWQTIYKEDAFNFYIDMIKNTMAMDDSFKKEG